MANKKGVHCSSYHVRGPGSIGSLTVRTKPNISISVIVSCCQRTVNLQKHRNKYHNNQCQVHPPDCSHRVTDPPAVTRPNLHKFIGEFHCALLSVCCCAQSTECLCINLQKHQIERIHCPPIVWNYPTLLALIFRLTARGSLYYCLYIRPLTIITRPLFFLGALIFPITPNAVWRICVDNDNIIVTLQFQYS